MKSAANGGLEPRVTDAAIYANVRPGDGFKMGREHPALSGHSSDLQDAAAQPVEPAIRCTRVIGQIAKERSADFAAVRCTIIHELEATTPYLGL